jgi:hypothetical protein
VYESSIPKCMEVPILILIFQWCWHFLWCRIWNGCAMPPSYAGSDIVSAGLN